MINGYAASASLWPGQALILHVATDAARFRVGFYRWDGRLVHMQTSNRVEGAWADPRGADEDWQWPAYRFVLPARWPSGVYLAHLEEPGAAPPSIAMPTAAVLFVVRGHGSSKMLFKIPLATYNAYNLAGGGCYYSNPPPSLTPAGARLSFRRPGIGIGGPIFGAPDHYDNSSPRQSFAHWDARFIGWLVQRGYVPEFCTDLDIDADPGLLARYRLLLGAGHDEYWSTGMRDAVERFIARGGNAAFFSANLCWWRVHLADARTAMVCHQGGPQGARDHWWPAHGAARPEDSLAGVSYRHGGGWWDGARGPCGYTVQDAAHWVFAGTGLQRGQVFGAAGCPPLVGYECDGAPLAAFDSTTGSATLAPAAAHVGTPDGFQLLAACVLGDGWQERPPREAEFDGHVHAATMGIYTRGGTVFTAGTTDWAQVLAEERDAQLSTITGNIIDGLLNGASSSQAPPLRRAPASSSPAAPALAPWLARHAGSTLAVFRALQLGDMLCAVPALRALRSALPATRITLVGLPWAWQFAERYGCYIDDFLAFPGHPALPEQPVQQEQHADFYAAMRARRFSAALQLHGSGEYSNHITRAFGASATAGYGEGREHSDEQFHPYPDAGAEPLRLLNLVRLLGAGCDNAELEFPLTEADQRELAASGLAAGLIPGQYICIHPGARSREKCWHPARFAQVADQIATESGLDIVLTGSAAEAPVTAAVASYMRCPARDTAAPLSIGAMAALMNRSRLLIANDTGVSHIAAGLKLPSVIIFSKADIGRWAPLDKVRHRCLWDPDGERAADVLAQARALLTAPFLS
jgi:ADP-heptose:LPS heptosyltransferase